MDQEPDDAPLDVAVRNSKLSRSARTLAIAETGMPDWAPKFLEVLSQTCIVRLSAKAAGISTFTAYNGYHDFPVLAEKWDIAIKEGRDILLAEAWKRALHGSDRMLALLLRMYYPEHFPRPVGAPGQALSQTTNNMLVLSEGTVDYDKIRRDLTKRYLPDAPATTEDGDFREITE